MRQGIFIPACLILLLLLIACSKGTGVITPEGDTVPVKSADNLPVFVSDFGSDGAPLAGMGTLGLFDLRINPSESEASLTSLRSAELTDVLEVVDITNFLRMAPCTKCVKINSVTLNEAGNTVVTIGIKHPFGVGNPAAPITGRNRADLHVFNIEGIIVSTSETVTFPLLNRKIADFYLVNADGYTGYLDDVLDKIYQTDANIHPYILHFDDYSSGNFSPTNPMGFASVTNPPPTGNLVMAMGCDYDYQDYEFDIGNNESFDVIYAVGCTYAVSSAAKKFRFTPEYRVPQHQKKAASEVKIEVISDNLVFYDPASTAEIEIRVVDTNHGVPVGTTLNQMLADSSVDDIFIDIPGVLTELVVLDGNNPVSGTGHDPSDPLIYRATITNANMSAAGLYRGMVKISDKYAPGQNTSSLLNGMDGISRVHPSVNPLEGKFPVSEFATYQAFDIEVGWGTTLPVAVLLSDPPNGIIPAYRTVRFDGTTSYDPDGFIVQYEFDFVWDGNERHFNPDEINTTGYAYSDYYTDAGVYRAGLRVIDNSGAPGYDETYITVESGCVVFVDDDNTEGPWDGTSEHPYQYIQDGVDNVPDNCTVWVKPGEYHEDEGGANTSTLAEIYLFEKLNIFIHGENYPKVIMHPYTGGQQLAAIHGFKSHGLVVDHMEFTPASTYQSAVIYEQCNNANLRNCRTSMAPSTGFREYFRGINSNNLFVANNYLDNIRLVETPNSTVFYLNGCTNSLIAYNKVRNLSHDGSGTIQSTMSYVTCYGSTNDTIACNIFADMHRTASCSNDVQLRVISASSGNNVIHNNLIYDVYFENTNATGLSRNWGIYADHCNNMDAYNNTIDLIGPTATGSGYTYGIQLVQSNNPEIYSNILSNLKAETSGSCYGVYSDASSSILQYSDVWNLTGSITQRFGGLAVEGIGCINANPLYTNPLLDDYTLQLGSPCKGSGMGGDDMGCYGGDEPLPLGM
jgi:hypothetical protein